MISNCRLFSEGVDVPNLTSVAFLDARDSQVDVVQAVGRVMRKVPGKKYGYIIVPVVVPPGRDVVDALEAGSDGYRLDINAHAVQLAACNLTLGAPTVDYRRMNLGTMPHGPQADGDVRSGSLELLTAADDSDSLHALLNPGRSMDEFDAEHVEGDERIKFQPRTST